MVELPKQQHYVPQFLLRGFAVGNRRQIHVFNKSDGRTFLSSVNKVASQRGFYNVPASVTQQIVAQLREQGTDVPDGRLVLSLEPALGRIENEAARVVRRIVKDESLAGLTERDRLILALFSTVQFLRAPKQRDLFAQLVTGLRERIRPMIDHRGQNADTELARVGLAPMTETSQAQMHLRHITEAPNYLPYFVGKTWLLQRVPANNYLYVGDNPITLWNHGPRGEAMPRAFGLGTLRSEIALPLTSRLCLVMLCPSILEESRMALKWVKQLRARGLYPPTISTHHHDFVTAAESGQPLELTAENVTHLNFRQVYNASRFVYACDGNFALARQVLVENPNCRDGPRIALS